MSFIAFSSDVWRRLSLAFTAVTEKIDKLQSAALLAVPASLVVSQMSPQTLATCQQDIMQLESHMLPYPWDEQPYSDRAVLKPNWI